MAWLTSRSLQTGFNHYLREKQEIELKNMREVMERYYRLHGDFRELHHNPRLVRQLLDRESGRLGEQEPPPELRDDEAESRQARHLRPPPRARLGGIEPGLRLSMTDENGETVFGPPRTGLPSLFSDVVVEGRKVASLSAPVPQFSLEKITSDFVRDQLRSIVLIALALSSLAILVSIWLGQHLVKPIAGLQKVTKQIASGQFQARAEIVNQDEIGGLAQHINSMAKSLETNERKRKKIVADLSHELRTPLTVMRAEVEALLDGVRPLNSDSIRSLEAEIRHLNKLVDDLHQLALADAGELRFQLATIDLGELVAQLGERFQARMGQAQLQLQVEVPDKAVFMQADALRMTQILENLLENSLRYTDAGGQVRMHLQCEAGLARLCVEDSAPGLKDTHHEQMFERLYREDKARSRVKGGSGLGLSICRMLVQAQRGEICASASTLGGVKMSMLFPMSNQRGTIE